MSNCSRPRLSSDRKNPAQEMIYSQLDATIRLALRKGNREEAYRAVDRALAALGDHVDVSPDDHISALGFDRRTCTILENAGIEEVRHLEALTLAELRAVYQVGPDLASKIVAAMRQFGKRLKPGRGMGPAKAA